MKTMPEVDFSNLGYHDDLLIVDVSPTPATNATVSAMLTSGSIGLESGISAPRGLAALQHFSRNGRIVEVTPVRAPSPSAPGVNMVEPCSRRRCRVLLPLPLRPRLHPAQALFASHRLMTANAFCANSKRIP